MIPLTINGKTYRVDVSPDTPLLWVLRDHLGISGTKFGCGAGLCGACTVHVDGVSVKSCSVLAVEADGARAFEPDHVTRSKDLAHQIAGRVHVFTGMRFESAKLRRGQGDGLGHGLAHADEHVHASAFCRSHDLAV